ncbi:MAG: patatin-like phospholipase family protein [Bacillota bacterium]
MPKKLGVVMSGGGARGAYQIGVMEVLENAGLLENVCAYSGSSVGSLNAVLLATSTIENAKDVWLSMDEDTLFNNDKNFFKRIFEAGRDLVFEGYYQTDKLDNLIDQVINYDAIKQKNIFVTTSHVGSEDPSFFELVSFNIRNAFSKEDHVRYTNLKDLDEPTMKKTLLASCALPIVFKPVIIDHATYYDGGVLDNTPIKPLIDYGCDEILLIDLFRFRLKRLAHDKDVTIHTIKPSKSLRGIMDFSRKHILRRYDLGKKDAYAFLETLSKN